MMRILCCGNRDRGDDAAGILVAERLRQSGVPAQICDGDPFGIMDAWNGARDVIIVDAVVTGAAPGTIHYWGEDDVKFAPAASASSHGFGLAEAVAVAHTLGNAPERLRVWGIEAKQFEYGSEACLEVQRAAEKMAAEIAIECQAGCAPAI